MDDIKSNGYELEQKSLYVPPASQSLHKISTFKSHHAPGPAALVHIGRSGSNLTVNCSLLITDVWFNRIAKDTGKIMKSGDPWSFFIKFGKRITPRCKKQQRYPMSRCLWSHAR